MNTKEPRYPPIFTPKHLPVSVKIQANTYSTLKGLQDELSDKMGINLSLSQTIAIIVHEHYHIRNRK